MVTQASGYRTYPLAKRQQYTADLERRLRKLQGVRTTIEIQLSTRKVAQVNERLRRLLRHVGVDEETINVGQ